MPIGFQDRSIFIWMFMMIASMSLYAVEEVMLKPIGIDLVSPLADPLGNKRTSDDIAVLINESNINSATENILRATNGTDAEPGFDKITNNIWSAAYVIFEMILLVSGLYVFNLMVWFGIPTLFTAIFLAGYILLLGVTMVKYLMRIG